MATTIAEAPVTPEPEESDPVFTVYNNAIFALSTAQAYFNWRAGDDTTPIDDQPAFAAAADEAAQELALLSAQLDAYLRGSPVADIDPPDQDTIERSKSLLEQLQGLNLTVASRAEVNGIIAQILTQIGQL